MEKRDIFKSKANKSIFLFVMMLPAIYGIIRYVAINGYSILLAFSVDEPFKDPFTLDWFKLFWKDMQGNGILAISLKNTLLYFVVGLIQQFICYVVAYFLYKKVPGHKVFRFAFYLPCLIAPVITTAIFMADVRHRISGIAGLSGNGHENHCGLYIPVRYRYDLFDLPGRNEQNSQGDYGSRQTGRLQHLA